MSYGGARKCVVRRLGRLGEEKERRGTGSVSAALVIIHHYAIIIIHDGDGFFPFFFFFFDNVTQQHILILFTVYNQNLIIFNNNIPIKFAILLASNPSFGIFFFLLLDWVCRLLLDGSYHKFNKSLSSFFIFRPHLPDRRGGVGFCVLI